MGLPQDGLVGLGGQYIIDKGLDRKHGFVLKPRWVSVGENQRLLAIKAISVASMTSEAALRANLAGVPVRMFQPYQTAHMYVLVRNGSPHNVIGDVRGRSVAVTSEVTTTYNLFDFIMRKRGFNIEKDFQLKKLAALGIVAVLEKGEVEAGILWEAHVSRLLSAGRYKTIMAFREELTKLLKTPVLPVIWIAGLESWIRTNPEMVSKLRLAWTEAYRGVQKDEAHFRKHAKQFFGLEKAEEVSLGWERTKGFLLPEEFSWPDAPALTVKKRFLREAVEMGMFPKQAGEFIEVMFVP
jgi:ABC-type nitrate/sulfonate/bicarbonate transport system substrate-binding protein